MTEFDDEKARRYLLDTLGAARVKAEADQVQLLIAVCRGDDAALRGIVNKLKKDPGMHVVDAVNAFRQEEEITTAETDTEAAQVAAVLGVIEWGPATLQEIVHRTGLTRHTALRLLAVMREHGLVSQLGRRGAVRFIPGMLIVHLAEARREAVTPKTAWEVVHGARRGTGARAARLLWRQGLRCLCSAQSVAPGVQTPKTGVPEPIPLAAARIFLAWPQPTTAGPDPLSGNPLLSTTPVEQIRRMGWAQSGPREPAGSPLRLADRTVSLAAPVLHKGQAVAALVLQGTTDALGEEPGAVYGKPLTDAARQIRTTHLGGVEGGGRPDTDRTRSGARRA